MKNISVIGSGTMGNGIAHVLALAGNAVSLVDSSPEALSKALATITANLGRQVNKGFINEDQKINALTSIRLFSNLQEGIASADFVIEAATENKDVKLELFRKLDWHSPSHCILGSNTSSIPIRDIASATNRKDKVIGIHFMNPVPIMELVEVIKTAETSDDTCNRSITLIESLGKTPILINDSPGFISNRILMPMINEAVYVFSEGIGSAEAIDQIMKLGMAHPMGPLKLADLIGLDICVSIMNVLYQGFSNNPKYLPCPLLIKMVQGGKKGVKSGEGFYTY